MLDVCHSNMGRIWSGVEWFALLLHSKKVLGLTPSQSLTFLYGVCMSSPCLRRFSLPPKTCTIVSGWVWLFSTTASSLDWPVSVQQQIFFFLKSLLTSAAFTMLHFQHTTTAKNRIFASQNDKTSSVACCCPMLYSCSAALRLLRSVGISGFLPCVYIEFISLSFS